MLLQTVRDACCRRFVTPCNLRPETSNTGWGNSKVLRNALLQPVCFKPAAAFCTRLKSESDCLNRCRRRRASSNQAQVAELLGVPFVSAELRLWLGALLDLPTDLLPRFNKSSGSVGLLLHLLLMERAAAPSLQSPCTHGLV